MIVNGSILSLSNAFLLSEFQLNSFQLITIIISLNYIFLISIFITGLSKLHKRNLVKANSLAPDDDTHLAVKILNKVLSEASDVIVAEVPFVSVLIAARNEASEIGTCIECFKHQRYPKDRFEVIIINDQSTDATSDIIKEQIKSASINLRQLFTSGRGGKKQAIYEGLLNAKGSIILTTDADCRVPETWIADFTEKFKATGAYFITGPVMLAVGRGLFNRLQCLEFNSLIASTAGSIGIGLPVMSNGANMGLNRELIGSSFENTKSANDPLNSNLASGEDVFMMQFVKKKYGGKRISFLDEPSTVVFTSVKTTLNEFIAQRLRWVSKSKGYKDTGVIYTAFSIFFFNLFILLSLFNNLFLTIYLFLAKCLIDFILILKYSRKYGQKELLWLVPVAEPFIIVYTVLIGILGNFLPFRWKGRDY